MTQIQEARRGNTTKSMKIVSEKESIPVDELGELIAKGLVVIPHNKKHESLSPIGIGYKLRTKVNANIGTSIDYPHLEEELKKLDVAIKFGADTVMDLSTGGNINKIRKEIMKKSSIPVGTVPIYQASILGISKRGNMINMTDEDLFSVIEMQAEDGVDFMTVHAGLTSSGIEMLRKHPRLTKVVSRGGAFIIGWMLKNQKENPFYEKFDRLLEIALKYDITLSLGDGLRPGSIADAGDSAQINELLVLGELTKRCNEAGVQVIVEGPGHVPLDQIAAQVKLQKRICNNAPFYVLGPLVTDVGAGYDHITAAIGGALAGSAGADFLCYVTPSEHIALPDLEDVRDGIIAFRIAAHAADIVKGVKGAKEWDEKMSKARYELGWEEQAKLSIDPEKFKEIREKRKTSSNACSMCSDFCAMKIVSEFLGDDNVKYLL